VLSAIQNIICDFSGFFIYDFNTLSITDRFTSKKAGQLALLFDVRMWISFLNEK
jgi:hypothetical protein